MYSTGSKDPCVSCGISGNVKNLTTITLLHHFMDYCCGFSLLSSAEV